IAKSDLINFLHNKDVNKVVKAVQEINRRKDSSLIQPLMQQLLLGHPPVITRQMLVALGDIGDKKAFDTLIFYSKHRDENIRITAINSLIKLKVKSGSKLYKKINKVLLQALRDYSTPVRAKAAWYLGKRKVKRAEESLLKLFKMKSEAAIDALGFIGGISTAKAFALRLEDENAQKGKIINSIDTLLLRKDFGPEPVRVQLVKILGRINLPAAQTVLLKYSGSGLTKFKRSRKLAYKILSK
ncbi:MAG: HEAT repeat domain-containing protein, partial [Myxococcota bacterium]